MRRYRVIQEVTTYVEAPDETVAIRRSARVLMGPWWQHWGPLRRLPWARRPVKMVGRFEIEER